MTRRQYDNQFKQEVMDAIRDGLSIKDASEAYGVHSTNIHRWMKQYGVQSQKSRTNSQSGRQSGRPTGRSASQEGAKDYWRKIQRISREQGVSTQEARRIYKQGAPQQGNDQPVINGGSPIQMQVKLPETGIELKMYSDRDMIGTLEIRETGVVFTKPNAKRRSSAVMPWQAIAALAESGVLGE